MIGFLGIGRHERLRTLLSSYIDGQVSPAEARQVEAHLSTCDECRRELQGLRATVDLLRTLPELEVSRAFTLASPPAGVAAVGAYLRATGLATSIAALLLVALFLGDSFDILAQSGQVEMALLEEPSELVSAAAVAAPVAAPVPAIAALAPAAAVAEKAAPQQQPAEVMAEDEAGVPLPLWQLELAVGALVGMLLLATLWLARRARRPSRWESS